ncbi:2880_t:CDS:2, partial [Scutellospora calospora]
EKHFIALSDNIRFLNYNDINVCDKALNHLQSILSRHGKCLKDFPNMPDITTFPYYEQENCLIREEQYILLAK